MGPGNATSHTIGSEAFGYATLAVTVQSFFGAFTLVPLLVIFGLPGTIANGTKRLRTRSRNGAINSDPRPIPDRNTASITVKEYVVDPNTRTSALNHMTSSASEVNPHTVAAAKAHLALTDKFFHRNGE